MLIRVRVFEIYLLLHFPSIMIFFFYYRTSTFCIALHTVVTLSDLVPGSCPVA